MKVTDLRRKLAASLVAGGLLAPGAAYSAELNTNLVQNPSFENVGSRVCCFSAVEILNWTDGTQTGFAYHTSQAYDAGGPLAGGGEYYFTSNGDDDGIGDITEPGQVAQNINVSTGDSAALIASGEAAVKLSAFFTSYMSDGDIGNLHVEFLNSGGTSLGSTVISAKDPSTWIQEQGAAFLPIGTATLRTSVYGTAVTFGPDGYIDLVDVQVTEAVNHLLYLEVNTTGGQVTIKNQTGETFHLDYYEIVSTGGAALNETAWNSLQEQNRAGFPSGNGTGNGWEESGGSGPGILSESYLTGNSAVTGDASVPLGAAFNVSGAQDLEFWYAVVPSDDALLPGDFSGNGAVENADLTLLLNNWGEPVPPTPDGWVGPPPTAPAIDNDELTALLNNWGNVAPPGGPGTLVRGFVRYVTVSAAGGAAAVPEPSSVLLVGIGLAGLAVGRRGAGRKHS